MRLELARTFFIRGRDGLARRHFELVLAGGVPPPVAINIYNFLNIMQVRKRWTGYFGVAIAPDSNLNAASESEIIYIDTVFGRLPFQREGDFGSQSGFGVSVWGGGEYQQPLSERLRLRVGADLAVREYPASDFDQTFLAAHAGPRWLASPITELSLLATAQRQWLGSIPYVDETGVRLELDRRLTPRILGARHRGVPRTRSPAAGFSRWPGGGFHRHLCVDAGAGTARAHDGGLRARPCGVGALAQPVALGAGGHLARPAAGFHPGHQRPDAAHVLRWQWPGAPDAKRRQAAGPHPHVHRFRPQPRLHRVRLQPAAGAHQRGAPDQRAGAGLRPQPRRAALRAAVLTEKRDKPLNSRKKNTAKLQKAKQALSRKCKRSNNCKKAKARVGRIENRIANARKDYLHKLSTQLCKTHAAICVEDLKVKNLSRSAKGSVEKPGRNVKAKSKLNHAILDQGWGEFRRQLAYKTELNGGTFVAVPPANTSRTCLCCGHVSARNRFSQARFQCVSCGFEAHADQVGAICTKGRTCPDSL